LTYGKTHRSANDIFMNNYTERTLDVVSVGEALKKLNENLVQYPTAQRCRARDTSGPIPHNMNVFPSDVRDMLAKERDKNHCRTETKVRTADDQARG